ncbi:hypothetical protein B566_EDAN015725 [Ephemera danica]|nr:hypothetical protein B566_EDAN015725 [Ephemera danica]
MLRLSEQYGQSGRKRSYIFDKESNQLVRDHKQRAHGKSSPVISWFVDWLRFIFLPQGYPSSVSSDYMTYQLWDTLQAFCSYLSGTLTTKAIMQGVGVGDATATPLAATITWVMRDGTGMIGRIVFASWKGPSLDANCKQWRLAADVLNDLAMTLELSSPLLPDVYFPWALCAATSLKSIARRGNMADVSAKDGSQETLVNLIASVSGVFMLTLLDSQFSTWLLFIFLSAIHLFSNYKAVRCLDIPILNNQRFNLLLKSYFASDSKYIPNIEVCGFKINLGASAAQCFTSHSTFELACSLSDDYIVLPSANTISVIFNQRHSRVPAIKAYFHGVLLGRKIQETLPKMVPPLEKYASEVEKDMTYVAQNVTAHFADIEDALVKKGWLMTRHQLLVDEWQADWQLIDKKHS